tara:strand:- start:2012 stop:2527 length:516 start_codon:yes stop_codon:yes gene_type:complete
VKNFYLFILLFILIGCKTSLLDRKVTSVIECPSILFSKEHKVYIDSKFEDITLSNISYKAEINNAVFDKKCKIIDENFSTKISILFVVNPLIQGQKEIDLPFYIAMLDEKRKIINLEYYLVSDNFIRDSETDILKETEVKTIEKINFKLNGQPETIVIGFMLDEKKLELLN